MTLIITPAGTVTSVSGTGTVAGLSLSGTVTNTGNLTLSGTLSTPVSTINDSTTVGQNLVKLANPSAIRFLRINADNTISALDDASFRAAIGVSAGTSVSVGDTAPVSPTNGSLWWDSTAGKLKIYYTDGTSNQWVDASSNTYGSGATSSTSIASASTITPTTSVTQYNVTALAVAANIATPSGTPVDGQKLMIRLEDNGTARALTWASGSGGYRAVGITLPTTTTAGKVTYVGCIYNSADVFWDVVGVATQA